MKKLVSVLLALMLLMSSAALAESVYVEHYSNLSLQATQAGQTQKVNLAGLNVDICTGLREETPVARVEVSNEDELLFGATIEVGDNDVLLALDGVDTPFKADTSTVSMTGASLKNVMAAALKNPEALVQMQLPAIPGITLPKLDLISYTDMLGLTVETDATGAQSAEFTLPYETVKEYMGMVSSLRSVVPEEAKEVADQVFGLIDNMIQNNSGFALDGTITDNGVTSQLIVNLYLVENGVTAETAAGSLTVAFEENHMTASVVLYDGDDSYEIGSLSVTSEPDAAKLDVVLDVMGMLKMQFSLYQEAGDQVVYFTANAMGEGIDAKMTYGPRGEGDFAQFELSAANMVEAKIANEMQSDGNGGMAGTLDVNIDVKAQDLNVVLTGDVAQLVADIELPVIANAENAADISELGDQAQAALSDLMAYLNTLEVVEPAA